MIFCGTLFVTHAQVSAFCLGDHPQAVPELAGVGAPLSRDGEHVIHFRPLG